MNNSIRELYNNLKNDINEDTIFFQANNRKQLNLIIDEMEPIFKRDRFESFWFKDEITLKDTYFILGDWRDGMFELGVYPNGIRNYDNQIHICADTKEYEDRNKFHREQINDLISVMDKYRDSFVQKRLKFDGDFNIVKSE